MHRTVISPSSLILLTAYAFQQEEQKAWSHDKDNVFVWVSSKQIGQTKGSEAGLGDSRLDLEVGLVVGEAAVSAVLRRVARRIPLVSAFERLVDVEEMLERIGAGVDGDLGSAWVTPADAVIDEELSMYFSMSFSLFQFKYLNKSTAVPA